MTTFYSNHYSGPVGATGHFTTRLDPQSVVDVGFKHGRLRRTAAQFTVPDATDMADNDIVRLFDFHSNDRLIELVLSTDANWHTTATFNVGLYLKGSQDDGAAVDEDLFAAATDLVNEVNRVDLFVQSTTLDDWDRGKQLWQLANIGLAASTYNVNSGVTFTVAMTASANLTVVNAAVEMLVEATYTAGD